MKTIIKSKYLTAGVISLSVMFLIFLSSFIYSSNSDDNGNTVSKERTVESFTGIKISQGLNLYITQGNSESLRIDAPEKIHEIIVTEVKEGILNIYIKKSSKMHNSPKIYVSVKTLSYLKASSGSDVFCKEGLSSENLKIIASSGSDMKLKVNTNKIICEMSSGSDITLIGKTNYIKIDASSGSDFNGYNLIAKNCKARASSAADIKVNVVEQILAFASSGSDITYKGSAKATQIKTSSGGTISNKLGE